MLVVAVVVWVLWPGAVEPRARVYRDVTACLLTDRQGVAGAAAAPVWAGMQAASVRTHGQVRFLAVAGEQTVDNAQTFVGTLMLGRCVVIVAAPGIADGAVRVVAVLYPGQLFVVVGGVASSLRNVSRVAGSPASEVTAQVSVLVSARLTSAG